MNNIVPLTPAPLGVDNMIQRKTSDGKYRSLHTDDLPADKKLPACANIRPTQRFGEKAAYFVPVSFVAQDWKVTPRRIRALLREGRLQGRVLSNGYWEVHFPYIYLFGTRGPALKRTQKQERRTE